MNEENQKLVVALYIRVSTDRQAKEGDSLEEQESELKKFCEYRGYNIHKIYIEKGKSGGNTNRPEYQNLLKVVKDGKIQAVVVKKIDRLSRSLLDFEAFMKLLQEKEIEFISIKENFDTTTALGKAMLRVALVFAQLEREQTAERIKDVMEYRASQGMRNGGVTPFGYTCVNKELIPYPKERVQVELIFKQFLLNKSAVETARFLNETGYRNHNNGLWDNRRIQDILQNPAYIGKMRWGKEVFQGIHQPIISDQVFEQIQFIFENRKSLADKNFTKSLLQKIIYCGFCGSPMTPSHSLNKLKNKYYYYRCTSTTNAEKKASNCAYKYVPFSKIEPQFIQLLLNLSEELHFKPVGLQIKNYNDQIKAELLELEAKQNAFQLKLDETKIKKEKYLDSLISQKFLAHERKLISDKIMELEQEEKQFKGHLYKANFEYTKKAETLIDETEFKKQLITFKADYDTFSHNQMREWINSIILEVTYYPDKFKIQFRQFPFSLTFVA